MVKPTYHVSTIYRNCDEMVSSYFGYRTGLTVIIFFKKKRGTKAAAIELCYKLRTYPHVMGYAVVLVFYYKVDTVPDRSGAAKRTRCRFGAFAVKMKSCNLEA